MIIYNLSLNAIQINVQFITFNMYIIYSEGTIASDKELLDQADQMLEREVSMPLLWQKN